MSTKHRGFTLVELMVTLAMAIILLAVGMPLFSSVVGSNRAAAQVNDLVSALKLARSEAVKRATAVTVCSSDDGGCGDAGGWTNGWIVYVDANDDGAVDPDEVLRTWEALTAASTVDVSVASVEFGPIGDSPTADAAADGFVNFELDNSEATGSAGGGAKRCVTVTRTGQVRSGRGACP
ncbi:MAG: GspH/FimT family pseudopilin [Chromatiaceae bacterium]|jgi:type IV fimbrial biogenesis protein FimT|nr:GspH/FimT family pseudopilin [Chromatiaceae bacterium]